MNNKKILIIEDEPSMLNVLNDTFQSQGFEILKAKNGEEGLTVALKDHPHLILLDVLMPKMDGLTMLEKLRQDEWGKNAKVIILTNVNAETDRTIKAIVENQPSYYLIKSDVKLDEVVSKAHEILSLP